MKSSGRTRVKGAVIASLWLLCAVFFAGWEARAEAATGIIVARTSTFKSIREVLGTASVQHVAGREFVLGDYRGERVVLVRSPMGKVNNAITTQLLISRFSPNEIFSIAPAGAVDSAVGIGDLVVAETVFQHDFGTVKPYGFIWGRAPDGTGFEEEGYSELPGRGLPTGLIKALGAAHRGQVFFGTLVTGDQLIASREKRDWLSKKFNALAVDMTAAAIVQTCFANGIPCRVLRIMTDHADETARSNFENALKPGVDRTDYQELTRILLGTR